MRRRRGSGVVVAVAMFLALTAALGAVCFISGQGQYNYMLPTEACAYKQGQLRSYRLQASGKTKASIRQLWLLGDPTVYSLSAFVGLDSGYFRQNVQPGDDVVMLCLPDSAEVVGLWVGGHEYFTPGDHVEAKRQSGLAGLVLSGVFALIFVATAAAGALWIKSRPGPARRRARHSGRSDDIH